MRRKLAEVALMVSFGLSAALPGAGAPRQATDPLAEGRAILLEATDSFFNQALTNQDVARLLDRGREAFSGLADAAAASYWQARVDYLYGIVERDNKNTRAAEQRFGASLRLLSSFVDSSPSSDAWRLMADNYAQLMIVNGILYAVTTGWKVRSFAEKALALDPLNAKALLTMALYFTNAPAIAGGSVERALVQLLSLRARDDLESEDRFAVRMWLGIAHGKKGDRAAARRYLQEAQVVYPGNTWVAELQDRYG